MHMRSGEWPEATPISDIECVGIVDSCPSKEFAVGYKVAATMSRLGRTIHETYAEYTKVPVSNVMKINDGIDEREVDWAAMAAIPESYATAWTLLFRNLEHRKGQKIFVRGETSALLLSCLLLCLVLTLPFALAPQAAIEDSASYEAGDWN